MLESFNFRLVKSGKHIEVYKYRTKRIIRGYKRKERNNIKTNKNNKKDNLKLLNEDNTKQLNIYEFEKELHKTNEKQKIKQESSANRTRRNIKRLANSNQQLNKFLTLTFAKPMTDLSVANKLFNTAMKRILRAKPYFEYLAVVEYQKDIDYYGKKKEHGGSVHYHLICNIKIPDNMDNFMWERMFSKKYWKNGFVKIKKIDNVDNMGAYFSKYLGKDMFDKRMFRKKKFFCSQTLKKPIELTGLKAKMFFDRHINTKPVYQTTYTHERVGKVDYSSYLLEEDTLNLNIKL